MGVLLGGLYGLVALGLSLIFGVVRQINLAHGDFVVLGSYLSYVVVAACGIDPIVSLAIGLPAFLLMGYLLQRFLLNYACRISSDTVLLVTFGISVVLQNMFHITWGPLSRNLTTSYTLSGLTFGRLHVPLPYLLDFLAAALFMTVLHLFLRHTHLGRAIRAVAQEPTAAQLVGVNVERLYAITFGIAMALCAVAGVFLGMTFSFTPSTGPAFLIMAFGVVVLGGLGSIAGTLIAGIAFGLVQSLSGHFLGVATQTLASYVMALFVLSIIPKGLFGD
jgi:branched-chain amino acid transport system permease protein